MLTLFVSNLTRGPLGPVQVALDPVPFVAFKFLGEPAVAALPSGVTLPRVEPGSFVRVSVASLPPPPPHTDHTPTLPVWLCSLLPNWMQASSVSRA